MDMAMNDIMLRHMKRKGWARFVGRITWLGNMSIKGWEGVVGATPPHANKFKNQDIVFVWISIYCCCDRNVWMHHVTEYNFLHNLLHCPEPPGCWLQASWRFVLTCWCFQWWWQLSQQGSLLSASMPNYRKNLRQHTCLWWYTSEI